MAETSSGASLPTPTELAGLTLEERQDLLARLSDEDVRALLLEYLQGLPAPGAAGADDPGDLVMGAEQFFSRAIQGFEATLGRILELPRVFGFAGEKLAEGRSVGMTLLALLLIALAFALGRGAEIWLLRKARRSLAPTGEINRPWLQLLLDLSGIALATLIAVGLFFAFFRGHEPTRLLFMGLLLGTLLLRIALALSRAVLAKRADGTRFVPFDDDVARGTQARVGVVIGVALYGFLFVTWLRLLGVDPALGSLLGLLVALLIVATLIEAIVWLRRPVAAIIAGPAPKPLKLAFARLWHLPAILYVLLVMAIAILLAAAGQGVGPWTPVASLLLLAVVPLISLAIRHVTQSPAGERTLLRRVLLSLLWIGTGLFLMRIWGFDLLAAAQSGLGGQVASLIFDVGLVLLLVWLAWSAVETWIARRSRPAQAHPTAPAAAGHEHSGDPEDHGLPTPSTRLATMMPLIRRFLQACILVIGTMLVLSAAGVEIGPLLAGAGVIGLAIGFGTQTLVKDIVSGLFFLVDDAFRVGEFIEVGSTRGQVEAIHVRSVVLRHPRGALHTLPYGEINQLSNYSRDWVIMKLEFRVAHDTDVDKVKKIFKRIGNELQTDPEFGKAFLEPLKSQGVYAMEEGALVLRAKFKTPPGRQFQIRKEVYRRVQKAFRENGIQYAYRRVAVEAPAGTDPQKVAAAVETALAAGEKKP